MFWNTKKTTNVPFEVIATLWPAMSHYHFFAKDDRLNGIRLNTAMTDEKELPSLLDKAISQAAGKDLYFDVKGRQLRVTKVYPNKNYLECEINHPITVSTPTTVMFKAGADAAVLAQASGNYLRFEGGPKYNIIPGESLHVRDPSLQVHGPTFTEQQISYLQIAKNAGIDKFMLSYAGSYDEIKEMRRFVGDDLIIAKIENQQGLDNIVGSYKRADNFGLLNARGDLFVEVNRPHDIIPATKKIINADPKAIIGSRILLSVSEDKVPSCSDLSEIEWLMDVGYRRFMLCDGLCLKKEPLDCALNVLHAMNAQYRMNHK